MKRKAELKSSQKMTDSCNKSNVSNRSNAKVTDKISNKSSKNIGFDAEASSFELDKDNEDSFKLR